MYSENPTLAVYRRLGNPLVVVAVLLLAVWFAGKRVDGYYLILAIIAYFLSAYIFDDVTLLKSPSHRWKLTGFGSVLFAWCLIAVVILFLGYASRLAFHYDEAVIIGWLLATPLVLFAVHQGMRSYIHHLYLAGRARRAVIVGGNEAGERLARRLQHNEYLMCKFLGYFDDRKPERLGDTVRAHYLGPAAGLLDFIRQQPVDVVYISLPISQKERISQLLAQLKDTTVSVYVVPDIFVYDLIQARVDQIGGIPVIAILETPFTNVHALNKRLEDIVLSVLILVLVSPILLLAALAVKLSSPGPVIFQQRRYGLNGEEIIVYKFRSMRVTEDGGEIRQAARNDERVTAVGHFLRRTSLDELPQFLNVLQGHMSIVGPRPHAVAHNELYRRLIPGYMLRHKAKPGITGWAQVNGLRGETTTVEAMAARVRHDLEYLRNWSMSLDLLIIAKTLLLVFKDAKAY